MDQLIKQLGERLVDLFDKNMLDWNSGIYTFTAIPAVNVSYYAGPELFAVNNSKLIIEDKIPYVPDDESQYLFIEIIKKQNLNSKANTIIFSFKNHQFSDVKFGWDQRVQDEFDSNLPKSKKGKIKAWYLS